MPLTIPEMAPHPGNQREYRPAFHRIGETRSRDRGVSTLHSGFFTGVLDPAPAEEIARRELEIQSLWRDLSSLKSLHEREMEEYRNGLQERYNQLEEQMVKRVAVGKAHFEENLAWTVNHPSKTLRRAREDHAGELAQARENLSFGARLVRMITWS